ncbi:MAG: hypothetical protein IRY87_16675 [Acetobacteraceae bacterium]|nr:hypothetical protein [Acetobacteraceae bacterium]
MPFKATCLNPQAVRRAKVGRGPEEISPLVSASKGHSRRNLRRSREEQWTKVAEMAALARAAFVMVGTISVAFDGPTSPQRVLGDAQRGAAAAGARALYRHQRQ